jgi:predicted DNA-binding transcriptional regulator AlpA
MTDDDILMHPPEVAEMLGVTAKTLWRWRQEGQGPGWMRLGPRKVVYRRDELVRWLKASRQGQAA